MEFSTNLTGVEYEPSTPVNGYGYPQIRSLSAKPTLPNHQLRRFPFRGVVLIVVPAMVTAYYAIIWTMVNKREDDSLHYGLTDENWIYYSWFIIGVFGLNASKFGLMGAEASMLHSRTRQIQNAMQLLFHSGSTWSGPGGWKRYFITLLHKKNLAGKLWCILAFLSAISFIAFPASGLVFELKDGYVRIDDPPLVIGTTWEIFNQRNGYYAPTETFWKAGSFPVVPGMGTAYTAPHVQREKFGLHEFPNTLPLNTSENPDIFLAPQAAVPIFGKSWGMIIGYNCSVVESFSDFTILNRRYSSNKLPYLETGNLLYPENKYPTLEVSPFEMIWVRNSTEGRDFNRNIMTHIEIGGTYYQSGTDPTTPIIPLDYSDAFFAAQPNGTLNEHILELALWQAYFAISNYSPQFDFNETIDTPLAGASSPFIFGDNGTVSYNETFLSPIGTNVSTLSRLPDVSSVAAPIGVRCIRHSSLGTAEIEAQGSFKSFEQSTTPPYPDLNEGYPVRAFGQTTLEIVKNSFDDFYTSSHSPRIETFATQTYYPGFLTAEALRRSLMLAHGTEALQLMYEGQSRFDAGYLNRNATSSKQRKTLTFGVMPPIIPMALFGIWTLGSLILGVKYGFSRRWAETLDGYSLFRFGADFSLEVQEQFDYASTTDFEHFEGLRRLPGLVGDARPDMNVGHISLVPRGNEPRKEKRYN
ncbi:hypothetical protein FQN55_001904 [Onygenales sp. PD_40]|nr:hypothetical protein FQN55_001904 [Onygenales sp. PD_40]